MIAKDMEAELGLFWRLARNHAALRTARVFDEKFVEIEDDLDAMASHSEWPALREAASRLLHPEQKAAAL